MNYIMLQHRPFSWNTVDYRVDRHREKAVERQLWHVGDEGTKKAS